jgi:2-polyprenyl-3-methyl-5-hydroxy-6-metoxy-1,4-benzoquinol methylase
MSKYDFKLDMKTQNSNSVILNNIKPNSTILEIGCAHGRMTKYLKETLNCVVDIAEKDWEAGNIAKQWCRHSWIGGIGDIEVSVFWNIILGDLKYDYVIFADVLEHLLYPQEVLSNSKSALKETGSVWISIPNIAYNGVIIDLINDKFTYRETGLLDNTHLRFFTINSLDKMIKKCGFKIVNEHNLKNFLKNSEFKEAYSQVPPQIASFLKFRPSGEVYQMVWELKPE